MSKYYDYFEEQELNSGEVTMDEFIAGAMQTDLKFNTLAEELQYQRTSRITLMNEHLTCYQSFKLYFNIRTLSLIIFRIISV